MSKVIPSPPLPLLPLPPYLSAKSTSLVLRSHQLCHLTSLGTTENLPPVLGLSFLILDKVRDKQVDGNLCSAPNPTLPIGMEAPNGRKWIRLSSRATACDPASHSIHRPENLQALTAGGTISFMVLPHQSVANGKAHKQGLGAGPMGGGRLS